MKKYIYRLFVALVATVTMVSCADDEGTKPGHDSKPAVTIYQYKPSRPYNADNDVVIRFATNNKAVEVYYLLEKTADKNSHVTSMGEEGYMDYVVSNGTKLSDVSGESNTDITLTDLYGDYAITAVAVNKSIMTSAETVFRGLDWEDVANGTYYFFNPNLTGMEFNSTVLQICTTDANLYRFKDVFGNGYHLKINLINYKDNDADGEYQFFRIPPTETPFVHATYGDINVRDVGYWQGNDGFVTEGGYESGMYADYNCFLCIQYYVSAGNLGYDYDFFVVD